MFLFPRFVSVGRLQMGKLRTCLSVGWCLLSLVKIYILVLIDGNFQLPNWDESQSYYKHPSHQKNPETDDKATGKAG